ncbi:MAG: hypothetical protein RMK35_06095 [Aquificaceae bacterium]|nr:hypothetical protein [Aquificaceae bacterium]MDW8434359.1 hypothetical protein [Aquificaceae bacterium]
MEGFLEGMEDIEDRLWQRRMKVLSQYEKVKQARDKISSLEKILEEKLGIDIETIYWLVEEYYNKNLNLKDIENIYDRGTVSLIESIFQGLKDIKNMKKELDDIEKEIFTIDSSIDWLFGEIDKYKKRLQ